MVLLQILSNQNTWPSLNGVARIFVWGGPPGTFSVISPGQCLSQDWEIFQFTSYQFFFYSYQNKRPVIFAGYLGQACAQMRPGAFKCKCKCKRRIKCKCKCKCSASESNANANANAQQLNQMQMQMHLNQMQMHLNQMRINLYQMQTVFYKCVFCVQQVLIC